MRQQRTQPAALPNDPFGVLQHFPQKKEKFEQKYVNNVFKATKTQRLFKNVYDSPFKTDWTPLSKEKTEEISTLLGKHYFSSRIQKKRPREGFVLEKKKDKKRRLREEAQNEKKPESDQLPKLEIQSEPSKNNSKKKNKNKKNKKSNVTNNNRNNTNTNTNSNNTNNNTNDTNSTNDIGENNTNNVESNEMEIDINSNTSEILSPKLQHKTQTSNYEWPILEGINAVTRSLEKNELVLVIICMNVSPGLIQHLPPLCCKTDTPMCVLSETSQNLGKLFGVNSVVAMGFKKEMNYSPLVEQISQLCPPFNIPWIKEKGNLLPLSYKYVEHFKDLLPVDKNGSYVAVKKTFGPKIRKPKVQAPTL